MISTVDFRVMSMTFTKLFSSITASTIWAARDQTRIVWITMLAMADAHGRVWASIPGLANIARVSIEACESALDELMSPDKYSRTKDHEGRRISEIDGGWLLLNYEKYRAVRDAESIKQSKRNYITGRRAKEKLAAAVAQDVETVELCRTDVDRGRHNREREEEEEEEDTKRESAKTLSPVVPEGSTNAGEACKAIRKAGISAVNPGHPGLARLLVAGVTASDLADTAAELVGKGKGGFAMLLATVEGRLRDAAAAGAVPVAAADPMAWRKTSDGVFGMGERLGVKPVADEVYHAYERRVLTAFQRAGQAQEAA